LLHIATATLGRYPVSPLSLKLIDRRIHSPHPELHFHPFRKGSSESIERPKVSLGTIKLSLSVLNALVYGHLSVVYCLEITKLSPLIS
jgi:hypothetical protein